MAEDYLNIDTEAQSEANVKKIDDIIEDHQQSKEEEDEEKEEEDGIPLNKFSGNLEHTTML
jgi:hypothetical protein